MKLDAGTFSHYGASVFVERRADKPTVMTARVTLQASGDNCKDATDALIRTARDFAEFDTRCRVVHASAGWCCGPKGHMGSHVAWLDNGQRVEWTGFGQSLAEDGRSLVCGKEVLVTCCPLDVKFRPSARAVVVDDETTPC